MFRSLFSRRKPALINTPAVRRLKTYSAQSGYVYQYYYEGQRPFQGSVSGGTEFVFRISPDRKNWHETSVLVGADALHAWEERHARDLTATERYAVDKMALFQAFDERASPGQMKADVHVRAADVEAIIEALGLE